MKARKTIYWLTLIAQLALWQPNLAVADAASGVVYLKAQTPDAWITMALAAAGESDIPTDHLKTVSGSLATDYSKAVLALTAAGENPKTFGNIDYVAKLKSYFSNNQIGDENLINDDMWTILALSSAGEKNSSEVAAAKNYILTKQNADGGWGYAADGESDVNDTAVGIMALIEAGMNVSNSVIANAVNYLKSAQNADGGFGWTAGSASDSGSDAWVISAIYKLGQDPVAWNKSGNNPLNHLLTLQDADGGFWWLPSGTSDFNNKAMSAFAVIALKGKSYPVGYYNENAGKFHLRIEGRDKNICDAYAAGATALEVVKNAAGACGYTYTIIDSSVGPYLSQINGEAAAGMSGWMYFVNYISPFIGANDYQLNEGDEVLWYYGDWGWQPLRLGAEVVGSGKVSITVDYFDGVKFNPLSGAKIKGAVNDYYTDSAGRASISLEDGVYNFYAEKENFVRSASEKIVIGSGVEQKINLSVEVEHSETPQVGGSAIIFEVSADALNFNKMKPGDQSSQKFNIINSGTVNLSITANVGGDSLFKDNLNLNGRLWEEYNQGLKLGETKEVESGLKIPADYLGSGVKTGELIFWAR